MPMNLFPILNLEVPSLKPDECKIHLAVWNGRENPLDEFLAGRFPAWQQLQSQRNFERPFVVSLIKMSNESRWLFAGVYSTHGCSTIRGAVPYRYKLKELSKLADLTGRLVVEFARPGRQSYLRAENWADHLQVRELKPERLVLEEFPGFVKVLLLKGKLDIIVKEGVESWRSALSSVAGVYLITDTKTGRHYIGSAYGSGGIWARWRDYSETGHGHNRELRRILAREGPHYCLNFQFSIVETADSNASRDQILARETHWKNALCCRESHGGYNAN
jgi:hypothetical protein